MKAHEIQDGIVLHSREIELNEQSKLRGDSFLALCKPLIELNTKNNTVDFVHFSAKELEFLLWPRMCANRDTDSFYEGQVEQFNQTGRKGPFSTIRRHITILHLVV